MKKTIVSILSLFVTICSMAQTKDYVVEIGDFHEFTVVNGLNVRYRNVPDSAGKAMFSCEPKIASAITFSNKNTKLKIEVISDETIKNLPEVTIYSLALDKATNWGDSTVIIDKVNPSANFRAKVIGNGDILAYDVMCTKVDAAVQAGNGHIFLTGKCQEAKYSILSAGAIEAGSMEANKVKASVTGTGSIDCNAATELKVSGIGSGTVYYKGSPKINNKSLGIKIVSMKQ